MSAKVLILGSRGTLGQELVRTFSVGFQVTAWDKEDCDVTSPQIATQIIALKPDIIINTTAYNAVDKAETEEPEKQLAFLLNSQTPKNLAKIAKDAGAIFVHYSTDYVFAGDNPKGYREIDRPDPKSVYGQSKFAGEENVKKVGGNYYIIRLSRLFGIKGKSQSSKKSFVEIMLEKINDTELMVKQAEVSSPTYAPDLAKLTEYLIKSGLPRGIYHGANSGACTWFEWAQEIFKIMGKGPKLIPGKVTDYHNPAPRPAYSQLLNTKLPPQRSWQEALAEFINNYQ